MAFLLYFPVIVGLDASEVWIRNLNKEQKWAAQFKTDDLSVQRSGQITMFPQYQ